MIDPRELFRRNVAKVSSDHRAASAALLRRLKSMSPPEFLKQPRSTFDRLTPKQYREVIEAIAPDVQLPNTGNTSLAVERPDISLWTTWWRRVKKPFLACFLVIAIALGGTTATTAYKWVLSQAEIVRPVSIATWPACARLSQYTDGCIYTPTQDLNWEWVADQLDMPLEVLRRTNRHQPAQFIMQHSMLIIWREKGKLEN